jgi:hypothetical protein
MAATLLSPIETKKKEINESANKNVGNNWMKFGLSIVTNILITLLIAVSGANFIYMTTAINKTENNGGTLLEKLLPTDEKSYFPGMSGGGANCSNNKEYSTNWTSLNNFGIGKKGGWPYNMYSEGMFNGLFQRFKNWFAKSTADAYITDRTLLQKWLSLFTPDKEGKNFFANETIQMFFISPLMFLIFPLVIIFIVFSSWFSLFKESWMFALVGMFLCYSWLINSSVSIVQSLQYLFTFMILPVLADFKRIKKIIGCNVKALSLFFGLLVCSSAFSYLDVTTAVTMFIVYLAMIVKSFW